MINLNAGNIWDHSYLDTVIRWNKEFKNTVQVTSLFGSISGLTPTARSADRIPYKDWAFLDRYIARCKANNIAVRYTLNHSCIGSTQDFKEYWDSKLKDDVVELHNIGVHEWTITSPLILVLLRGLFPNDFLEVSTIVELSTPEEAKRWEALGANGVNISTSINRDFEAIQAIKDFSSLHVSILANEACLFRCPFRRECYNLSSHNSARSEELFNFYPFRWCNINRLEHPTEWLKARLILPQWMGRYGELVGVDSFKIAYRTHPKEVALPILRAYMEQKHTGNLLKLWPTIAHLGDTVEPQEQIDIPVEILEQEKFLEHFTNNGHNCTMWGCDSCSYCDRLFAKICAGSISEGLH